MKIWHRYLFNHLTKTFGFFLLCIFSIYTIVDLSIHGVGFFSHGAIPWTSIAIYYLHTFANHLGFFFPLTLLLASLKVLLDLNTHHELVALQMAGLSQKKLLAPFFIFAFFLTLISFANQEFVSPIAQSGTDSFQKEHAKKKKKTHKIHLYSAALQDKSELIYQNVQDETLFDVFWVKSNKDIWHIKYLQMGKNPTGRFVDHFQRQPGGLLEKTESFETFAFPHLVLDDNVSLQAFVPFENRSLSTLFQQSLRPSAEKKSVLAHLHYKLATPLLSFLVLFAITPFALRFSRSKPVFLIAAMSLFGFIGFMTLLDGMLILGENQVIPGLLAIWGPLFTAFLIPLIMNNKFQ